MKPPIRREITPASRSRAFVNDTPVSLNQLKELGSYLIDINSQHKTLLLNSQDYQLKLVDAFCNHKDILYQFKSEYQFYLSKQNFKYKNILLIFYNFMFLIYYKWI